jgi:Mrp family chromosome partitioning ATPase
MEGKPRVGLLDLDIFGPSIPKLMGLEGVGEPYLTPGMPAYSVISLYKDAKH